LVTNDTGPRHIAAAFGVPTVTLFGPTDPRWTTLPPGQHPCENIVADPTLPEHLIADDFPERCAIERIEIERVLEALRRLGC
jgi:heptosyltransferase-2